MGDAVASDPDGYSGIADRHQAGEAGAAGCGGEDSAGAGEDAALTHGVAPRGNTWLLRIFLFVPTAYLLAVVGFPVVYNLLMSVQEVNLGNIADLWRPFVGLSNYTDAIADPTFRKAAGNTVVFVVANVVGQVGIGLVVAVCFARNFPGANYMRGLLLAAWMLPGLVVGTVWKWLFATQYGAINYLLASIGVIA